MLTLNSSSYNSYLETIRWPPTKEQLTELYITRQLSLPQISELTGKSDQTISYHLKKNGINLRNRIEAVRIRWVPEAKQAQIVRLFMEEKLSITKIGELVGLERHTVSAVLQRNGVQTSKPKLRPLVTPEQLRKLYWNEGLSLKRIAAKTGIPETTLYSDFKRYKIQLRPGPPRHHLPTADVLRHYVDEKLTTYQIAALYGVYPGTIARILRKEGIKARDNSYYKLKYLKRDFDGTEEDKAYYLGLITADFSATGVGNQVMFNTSTTHPAFIQLTYRLFKPYGHVNHYPLYSPERSEYKWHVYTLQNLSFSFGVPKPERLPVHIAQDKDLFLSFFSGYFDGEGWITFDHKGNWYQPVVAVGSQNQQLLEDAKDCLKELFGITSNVCKTQEAGTPVNISGRYYYAAAPCYRLTVYGKSDVYTILGLLRLRHTEKLLKRQLALEHCLTNKWSDILDSLTRLQRSISVNVERCVKAAAREYLKRKANGLAILPY